MFDATVPANCRYLYVDICKPTMSLAAIQDLDVLEVACELDTNLDGQLDRFEIDADQDGHMDAAKAVSRRLSGAQFQQFEALLCAHAIPVSSPTPPAVRSTSAAVSATAEQIFDIAATDELSALPFVSASLLLRRLRQIPDRFVPEYLYRAFSFNYVGLASYATCSEMLQLAQTILTLKPDANVYFTTDTTRCSYPLDRLKRAAAVGGRLHISGKAAGHLWMQDAGEPLGGSARIFVSGAFDQESALADIGMTSVALPVSLPGGNVTKTTIDGKKVLIVGDHLIDHTITQYQSRYGYTLSAKDVTALLAATFGAERVIILRNTVTMGNPGLAFHIDQQVFFPRDGVAIMPRVLPGVAHGYYGGDCIGQFCSHAGDVHLYKMALAANRAILQAAGFQIIEIPLTADHVTRYQAYTNSIVLTTDSATHIIMPSFATRIEEQVSSRVTVEYPGNAELEPTIQTILESHGFHVHFVPNTTFPLDGNSHCLTGMLW